jgi:acetylornithine/N-succinyldiaminopimelate aminotransferase
MTLAKALGGGIAIGAMTAKKEIAKSLVPGSHASTFGGNPLACAAGVAVFETIEKEGLLDNVKKMGNYSIEQFKLLQSTHKIINEVRGMGLMIGIELNVNGAEFIKNCIQSGLFLNCTHDKVIRFMPPLNVKKEHIDEGLNIIKAILSKP